MLFKSLALVSRFALMLTQPGVSYMSNAARSAESIRSQPVTVGEEAPDFTLKDTKGDPVTLSSARGKMPTVLVFFRGYWCPFCAHQLAELRALLKSVDQVRLLAVSVDEDEKSKHLVAKVAARGKGPVPF